MVNSFRSRLSVSHMTCDSYCAASEVFGEVSGRLIRPLLVKMSAVYL